ncbi:MAG: M1 family aminopeptidase [Polyangiaceae bacterium]
MYGPRLPVAGRRVASALALALASACGASNDITISPTSLPGNVAPTVAPPALPTGRLPELARPSHYALDWKVDPAADHLEGRVKIAMDVPRETSVFVLHGRDLSYKNALVVAGGNAITASLEARESAQSLGVKDELVVTLPQPIQGSAELVIEWSAPYTDELVGAYKTKVGAESYVFTQFESMSARRAFPCFDDPSFKVPFEVSITTPPGNIAVSNTGETARKTSSDGKWITYEFRPTKPLPTYLLAFAVGPLDVIEAKDAKIPLRVITVKGKSSLGQLAIDATKAFLDIQEKYFDIPYPFDKLDLVAVPDFAAGAMENAGLITFREELILADARSPASSIHGIGVVIAHELAHHWFGNLVTMEWWEDLWLNEGFATWMEEKTVDLWRPDYREKDGSVAGRSYAMRLDTRPSARAVRREIRSSGEAEEAFDPITYNKGSAVIGMLESWLGADAFQQGVRKYLKSHEYGNASAKDLFQALAEASGKDVVGVASSFLDRPGVPLVKVELDCKTDASEPKLIVSQERLVVAPPTAKAVDHSKDLWKIPVCADAEGRTGGAVCTIVEGATGSLGLGKGAKCPTWITPNVDEYGYYRWSIPGEMFRALSKATLSPRTRYGVIDDAATLVESGRLGADVLFDLLEAMRPSATRPSPSDMLIAGEMVSVIEDLHGGVIDDAQRAKFAKFTSDLLLPIAKSTGWDAAPGEGDDVKIFRRDLFAGLVPIVDDPWLKAEGKKHALEILKDPTKAPIENSTSALVMGARYGDAALFESYLGLLRNTDVPQFRPGTLIALGCFDDPALLRRAFDLMLQPDMRKQDALYVLRGSLWFPKSRATALAWIDENQRAIDEKLPTWTRTGMADALLLCDPDSLAKAHSVFDGKLDKIEGGAHALEELYERSELCIAERAREGARISKRLKVK